MSKKLDGEDLHQTIAENGNVRELRAMRQISRLIVFVGLCTGGLFTGSVLSGSGGEVFTDSEAPTVQVLAEGLDLAIKLPSIAGAVLGFAMAAEGRDLSRRSRNRIEELGGV